MNNNKGQGGGEAKKRGGLINLLPLKRESLFERRGGGGGLNRGFTVFFGKNLEQVIELGHQKNEIIKFK